MVRAFLTVADGPIRFSLVRGGCDVFGGISGATGFGIDASELSGRRGGGAWARRLVRRLAEGAGVGSDSTSLGNGKSKSSIEAREEGATAVAWARLLILGQTVWQWVNDVHTWDWSELGSGDVAGCVLRD